MKALHKILFIAGAAIFLATQSQAILFWARPYDPNLGRWIQRDPIGEQGGLNLYGYVGNNPIVWIDPFGLNAYVINAGGYTGHTSFVVDDPSGGVIAYHFFAANHNGIAPWYMQDMGLFYDSVNVWSQQANSLKDYLASEGKIYGKVSILAMGAGTKDDDAKAIQRMQQNLQDQDGFYSFLGGSECHKQSWDWFHDYTFSGQDVASSQMEGLAPLFINGQLVGPPDFISLTADLLRPQYP